MNTEPSVVLLQVRANSTPAVALVVANHLHPLVAAVATMLLPDAWIVEFLLAQGPFLKFLSMEESMRPEKLMSALPSELDRKYDWMI